MSASESNYPQLRDLRTAPDPLEPSFSDEESFVNCQPAFIQNEDEMHQKIDRSCHRSSYLCTGSYIRSIKESAHKDSRRSLNHTKTDTTSPIHTKCKRRQKNRDRAMERFCKLDAFTSGSDRGKIVDITTDLSEVHIDIDVDDNAPGDLLNLQLPVAQQRVVSLTPDCFIALHSLSLSENEKGIVGTTIVPLRHPSHHNVESSCDLENALNSVPNGSDRQNSNDSGKSNAKSISTTGMKLNRIDINPNERRTKVSLNDMNLCCLAIPTHVLCGTPLGGSLQNLSLSRNPLREIPPKLVVGLPALEILNLSGCQLHQLPQTFHLPKLRVLNLRDNALTEFPNENVFIGLPNLCELNMQRNQLTEITLPRNESVISKLETLDLGFNYISVLPIELDQLVELRHLSISNNFLSTVPMRLCEMKLQRFDVSCNHSIIEPPIHICELGIFEMRQYWRNVRMEANKKIYTTNDSITRVSRKGNKSLTKPVTLASSTTLSDLSESTTSREQSFPFASRSSSSMTNDDRPAMELYYETDSVFERNETTYR